MGVESTSAAGAACTASTLNTFDPLRRSLTTMTMATRNRHTQSAGRVWFRITNFRVEILQWKTRQISSAEQHVLYISCPYSCFTCLPVWLIMSRITMRTSSVMAIPLIVAKFNLNELQRGFPFGKHKAEPAHIISFYSLIDPSLCF